MIVYHGKRKVRVKAKIQYPIQSALSYLISNDKQSWHVPQSQVRIIDNDTLEMPQWLAVKAGIPISDG